jgi:arylsulfatase
MVLFSGMSGLNENCMLNTKNKSHSVTAEVSIPDAGAEGVLIDQGGMTGGWALYFRDGLLKYHFSFLGFQHWSVEASKPITSGHHQVRMEFAYDGGGLGKGGTATLFIDGEPAGSGRVEKTHAFNYSLDETTDVGRDTGAPVTDDYRAGDNAFTGAIDWIRMDIGTDSHDHLIDPAQLLQFAMSRQ